MVVRRTFTTEVLSNTETLYEFLHLRKLPFSLADTLGNSQEQGTPLLALPSRNKSETCEPDIRQP